VEWVDGVVAWLSDRAILKSLSTPLIPFHSFPFINIIATFINETTSSYISTQPLEQKTRCQATIITADKAKVIRTNTIRPQISSNILLSPTTHPKEASHLTRKHPTMRLLRLKIRATALLRISTRINTRPNLNTTSNNLPILSNNPLTAANKTCPARPTQSPTLRSHPTPKIVPAARKEQASKVPAKTVREVLAQLSSAAPVADF
jgi:hypothetical protein